MSERDRDALRHLRIADLELWVSASRLKNLGRAAVLYNMSQSAASAAILRVEAAFGKELCAHERRQFRLAQSGIELLPRAEAWLKQLREVVATETERPVRLATTHAIARLAIPAMLSIESVDLQLLRPNRAYEAIMHDEADIALVLDNFPWEGVVTAEIGRGLFQLYCSCQDMPPGAVLLPESQIEVIALEGRWQQLHGTSLPVKARLPSWSLIADICAHSSEIGFLPDFLAKPSRISPVSWQPPPSSYRLLALYRKTAGITLMRIEKLLDIWRTAFSPIF